MKILIIGGTKFLGRHLAEAAIMRHHTVTLFNRGKYSAEDFGNIEQIHGDRFFDLNKLENRRFDAVIDTCGYLPQSVKDAAETLKNSVGQYVFISSISGYADFSKTDFDESAPLAELNEKQLKQTAEINKHGEINGVTLGEFYGGLKILCERAVENAMPNRALIIRPGLIVGAYDTTDRFTYWVKRVTEGGEIIAPGSPDRFVQFIDARDLSEWTIKMIEQSVNGIYNANGKPFEMTMEKMLNEIKFVARSDAEFVWVSEEFLNQENVREWSEMPLYLPESVKEMKGFLSVNVDKALNQGLELRPLNDTIKDVLDFIPKIKGELKAGISAEREFALLNKWREQF